MNVKDTSGNISLQKTIIFYKTTFYTGGGSVSPSYLITKSGNSFKLPIPKPPTIDSNTYCGYSFVGWDAFNSGNIYTNQVITASSDRMFSARWESYGHNYVTTKKKAVAASKKNDYNGEDGLVETKCSICGRVKSSSVVHFPASINPYLSSYNINSGKLKKTIQVFDSYGYIIPSSYYSVKYSVSRHSLRAKVTFKGIYSGSMTEYIYTTLKPTPSITSIKSPAKKTITIKWKKIKKISGYRVMISTKKDFSKGIKTYDAKSTSKNAEIKKDIKGNKKYYIEIFAYGYI